MYGTSTSKFSNTIAVTLLDPEKFQLWSSGLPTGWASMMRREEVAARGGEAYSAASVHQVITINSLSQPENSIIHGEVGKSRAVVLVSESWWFCIKHEQWWRPCLLLHRTVRWAALCWVATGPGGDQTLALLHTTTHWHRGAKNYDILRIHWPSF